MPIDLVDLTGDTYETYGPFATPLEAHKSAKRSGFITYSLWENGKVICHVKDASQFVIPGDGE